MASCALALWAGGARGGGSADEQRVAILFGRASAYRAAAGALAAGLRAAGYACELFELDGAGGDGAPQGAAGLARYRPTVIASAGVAATVHALRAAPAVPVVYFMVPNALDAPFVESAAGSAPGRGPLGGLTCDVGPDRQADWIRQTCPRVRRVAVLCSDRTRRTCAALRRAGRQRGIEIIPILAIHDRFPEAIEALERSGCGGVLMIPDAKVYNSPNVQRLLLWGLRSRKPVWTFSRNVVRAGAYGGLYCDPAELGRQAAELIQQVIRQADVAAPGLRYPRAVGRALNAHTAEMIGLRPDAAALGPDVEWFGKRGAQ